jgi:hypothetical protein
VEAAENKAAMRRILEHVINEKNLDAANELSPLPHPELAFQSQLESRHYV